MGGAFNITMKGFSMVLGFLVFVIGLIWIGQGAHVGPDVIMRGFMVGDWRWSIFGAILAILGIGHLIWSFKSVAKVDAKT